jgi:hypothetical protein
MMERLVDFINRQELIGATGAKARRRLKDAVDILRPHYPEMATMMEKELPALGEQAMTAKATAGIVQPGIVNTPKRWAAVGGNVAGQIIHKIASLPPEGLQLKAQQIMLKAQNMKNSKAAQELANVLFSLQDKNARERNAILFGVMQNPAYRQWLNETEPQNEDMVE